VKRAAHCIEGVARVPAEMPAVSGIVVSTIQPEDFNEGFVLTKDKIKGLSREISDRMRKVASTLTRYGALVVTYHPAGHAKYIISAPINLERCQTVVTMTCF